MLKKQALCRGKSELKPKNILKKGGRFYEGSGFIPET
jgi:hypothetical protein